MTRRTLLVGRIVLLLLFLVAWGGGGGAMALAEEGPEADAAEVTGGDAPAITLEIYEEMLQKSPATKWALLLLKIVPLLLGIAFLVVLYRSWSRRQAAGTPGPGLGEPPGPTVPLDGFHAVLVTVAATFLGGSIAFYGLSPFLPGGRESVLFGILLVAMVEVPLALLVVFRRQHLRQGRMTAPRRALGLGFVTFTIGSAVALPLAIAGASVLTAAGEPPVVQDVLLKATDASAPANLWLIALFGIFVAPFVEESIFRALFFPALRQSLGGGRRGFWIAAIVVSLVFASIHENWYAVLPLFGLAMVLTIVFEKTNSLSTVVLGHALYNASTMVPLLIARLDGVI